MIDYNAARILILSEEINHSGYHYSKQKIASMVLRGFENLPIEIDAKLMESKVKIVQKINSGNSIKLNDGIVPAQWYFSKILINTSFRKWLIKISGHLIYHWIYLAWNTNGLNFTIILNYKSLGIV